MTIAMALQLLGALLIVSGFVLSQAGKLDPHAYPYQIINLVGAVILTVLAYQDQRWGFVLLEGVWTVISLVGLVMLLRGKEISPGH